MAEDGTPDKISGFKATSRMAGAVAHDFNNILTGVLGNLELLERRAAKLGVSEFVDYLKGARSAAARGVELSARLLAVSGHQALEPRQLLISTVIDDMKEALRDTLGPDVRLEIAHDGALGPVFVDQAQFEEALLSMARNARDAMPGGGTTRIELRNTSLGQPAAAGMDLPAGDYVAVTMRDSGTGMSDEVAMRAFEPFFTTKSSGAGTGLGLATVLGFMRQSGGHARIGSHAAGKTEVTLLLPRSL
jgi:signal transduction histidine kinase